MRTVRVPVAGLMAIGWPQIIPTQGAAGENAAMAGQITEARKANAALMRRYTWSSRTELLEAGQVKDIRIEQVGYSPDGTVQRSLLNDQSARLRFGSLRRALIESERQKGEEYLIGLAESPRTIHAVHRGQGARLHESGHDHRAGPRPATR